jgi:DNA-binding LacI/PurR family transcriptional regulator
LSKAEREGSQRASAQRRVTLTDVAVAAGVSVTTASNVVNGRLEMMSLATRVRVESALRVLKYRPDEGARSLRLARKRTIGLIVVDDSPRFLTDAMNTNIITGLSNYLSVNGFGLLLTGLKLAALEDTHLIRRDQTDALCVIPSGSTADRRRLYIRLKETLQPILIFQDRTPGFMADAAAVRQDDLKAGALIAERVINRGARRLALLAPSQQWPAMIEREAGIRSIIKGSDKRVRCEAVVCGSESVADTQQAIARYVDRNGLPDVFIGGNDQMAIAALGWALDRHLCVPADVRVTGFNGFEFAKYVRPSLTTVVSSAYEMGKQGAALLLKRLSSDAFDQTDVLFDVALQVGESD